jgi:hypothetical protein
MFFIHNLTAVITEVIPFSFHWTDTSTQLWTHLETSSEWNHVLGSEKKETISPSYVAHQLKASSFAYKNKASKVHLLHMLLSDSSTILSVQNVVRG